MTASIDLSTTYLGFKLPHPFMLGASPLVDDLDTVRRLEDVRVPVVGSLNGTSAGTWLTFARLIQHAGADALELNMYNVVTDPQAVWRDHRARSGPGRGRTQAGTEDPCRREAVAVFHGARQRGPGARPRGCRRVGAVQPLLSAGLRHPGADSHAARRAVVSPFPCPQSSRKSTLCRKRQKSRSPRAMLQPGRPLLESVVPAHANATFV